MSATHANHSIATAAPVLYLALELSGNSWKLAFTVGLGQKPRLRTIPARDTAGLVREIARAKDRFGLPAEAPVVSCYEAGRDGFWLHRFLVHHGIDNRVVDSASIEVNRRQRRAKSDALDATKLVEMLIRWRNGESKVWSIVQVPTVEDEDRRQRHRELIELKAERTEHTNRIKGLLAALGLSVVVDAKCPSGWRGCGSGTARRCRRACASESSASSRGGSRSMSRSVPWRTSSVAPCATTPSRTWSWCVGC
jgi:transposase